MLRLFPLSLILVLQPAFSQVTQPTDQTKSYYFTGEITASGVEVAPSGKFGALRVSVGVVTPGGACGLFGQLSQAAGGIIDREYSDNPPKLPPGKSVLTVDFNGARIARSAGGLIVSGLNLLCKGRAIGEQIDIEDAGEHYLAGFFPSNFENVQPDFEILAPKEPFRVQPGETEQGHPHIRMIGGLDSIELTLSAGDSRIQIEGEQTFVCQDNPYCWREGNPMTVIVSTPADLPPGTYPIRVTGKAAGREHTVALSLIVDSEINKERELLQAKRAKELEPLIREDVISTKPPVLIEPKPGDPVPYNKFTSEVALRKIHAVLVIHRSGSLLTAGSCEFMKAAAIRFSRLFIDGRDSLGVITFGTTAQSILPLTDHFQDVSDRISKIQCIGGSNTGKAIALAQQELARNPDPEAINAVILLSHNRPALLNALLTVKARNPPAFCAEAQGGQVAATLVPFGRLFMTSADASDADEHQILANTNVKNSCFGIDAPPDYTYLPDVDLYGIPFTGSRPLERYATGPYTGKIRIDLAENISNAADNQLENAAQRLRSDPQNPASFYAIRILPEGGRGDAPSLIDQFQKLVNDPNSASFKPDEAPGLAITAKGSKEIWPAFQRVREAIVGRATVSKAPVAR